MQLTRQDTFMSMTPRVLALSKSHLKVICNVISLKHAVLEKGMELMCKY